MYQWDPEEYARHSSEQEKWARELITKLDLKGDERVLDIGCGDGKITAGIARSLTGGSVVGIDNSADMIAHAKTTFMDTSANLAFVCMDAREMTFEREFDVVFSNAALHWVHEHLAVLQGAARALRPSGKVLFQMAGEGNAAAVVEVVNGIIRKDRWRPFFEGFSFPYAFYGDKEYRDLIEAAGLLPVRVELIPKVMAHKEREGLAGWIGTTWLPYIQRAPEEMREQFIAEIAAAYEAAHADDEHGPFAVGMMRLEVEATIAGR